MLISWFYKLSIISFVTFAFFSFGFLTIILLTTLKMDKKADARAINTKLPLYFFIFIVVVGLNISATVNLNNYYVNAWIHTLTNKDYENISVLFFAPIILWISLFGYILVIQNYGYRGVSLFLIDDKLVNTYGKVIEKDEYVWYAIKKNQVKIFLKDGVFKTSIKNKFILEYFNIDNDGSIQNIIGFNTSEIYKSPIGTNTEFNFSKKDKIFSILNITKYCSLFLSLILVMIVLFSSTNRAIFQIKESNEMSFNNFHVFLIPFVIAIIVLYVTNIVIASIQIKFLKGKRIRKINLIIDIADIVQNIIFLSIMIVFGSGIIFLSNESATSIETIKDLFRIDSLIYRWLNPNSELGYGLILLLVVYFNVFTLFIQLPVFICNINVLAYKKNPNLTIKN